MKTGARLFAAFLFLTLSAGLYPETEPRGDAAAALRYAQWAKEKIEQGLWKEALAGLERASDFADVSSDISYLLALARAHEKERRGRVLEALGRALAADRWTLYQSGDARLLRAETLIAIRAYAEALDELPGAGQTPREAGILLKILAASRPWDFLPYLSLVLDRYPRESGPVRIFFTFLKNEDAAGRNPGKKDRELLELVIRRLPVLLLYDRELAWMAAPFMRDSEEAKRLIQSYRVRNALPESLPAALRFGVIDEAAAVDELFAFPEAISPLSGGAEEKTEKILDRALLEEIWELLRNEGAKERFSRNLSAYSGVITEDTDRDGIPESSAEYYGGMLREYRHDADQDGFPDLSISFEAGEPRRALTLIPPESSSSNLQTAIVRWERYPSVLEAEFDGVRYVPRPLEFYFSPVRFIDLWGSGLLFPVRDVLNPSLTRRILVFNALRVERPSLEFSGALEAVQLAQGIPLRAREYTENSLVSETEFLRGRPQLQRADLDLDGRMETVRFFRRNYRMLELEELWNYDRDIEYSVSDWDGDGIYESRDSYTDTQESSGEQEQNDKTEDEKL